MADSLQFFFFLFPLLFTSDRAQTQFASTMSTQVQLFDTPLSLLSIPRPAYGFFCQGILKLLLDLWQPELIASSATTSGQNELTQPPLSQPQSLQSSLGNSGTPSAPLRAGFRAKGRSRSEDNSNSTLSSPVLGTAAAFESLGLHNVQDDLAAQHEALNEFINVSFTPQECSIICPTVLVDLLFKAPLEAIGNKMGVLVLGDTYLAIKVDSDGQDTGASLLSISKPLSAASVPIFFIATYFSDYVLVPAKARHKVSKLLENQGFVFSNTANSYVVTGKTDTSFSSPPPSPLKEPSGPLRELLEINSIVPHIDCATKLLLTGARSNVDNSELMLSVAKLVLAPPKFYSLTLSSGSELSFLIDSNTSSQFPAHSLLGSPTDFVYPILFDLSHLPQDATGIVSGVAEMLTTKREESSVDLRYLSTALSGLALVGEDDVDFAVQVFGISQ